MYKRTLGSQYDRVSAKASSPDDMEFIDNGSMEVLILY